MEKFAVLESIAAYWPAPNVDTDTIIRIERCTRVAKKDMGRWAFETVRYRPDGSENPEFVLNREPFREARILVCGENFGCGSSREMAVWAIAGMGIRCVIAPSFGEIFYGNCLQNAVLPVRLPRASVERLGAALGADPARARLTVDLDRQRVVTAAGEAVAFEIDARKKRALLEGLDAIGLTLTRASEIAAWQAQDRRRRPWVYL